MGLLAPTDWQGDWIAAETALLREDRQAGLQWMRGPAGTDNRAGYGFRLDFDLPEAADLILYTCANRPVRITLGDIDVPVRRDPMRFGPPPTDFNRLSVKAGAHRLALSLTPDPLPAPNAPAPGTPPPPPPPPPHVAVLIRATLASGKVLRFTGETLLARPGPDTGDAPWSPATPDTGSARHPGHGAFLLRRRFAVTGLRAARLYVAAMGAYVPWLNGHRLGDALLAPEWTDFRKHVLYRVHDVTDSLTPGDNVLGALVGDGWYGSYLAPGAAMALARRRCGCAPSWKSTMPMAAAR
jgi:alpha-L-rhamnosidase